MFLTVTSLLGDIHCKNKWNEKVPKINNYNYANIYNKLICFYCILSDNFDKLTINYKLSSKFLLFGIRLLLYFFFLITFTISKYFCVPH